jgi:hypothetical protein
MSPTIASTPAAVKPVREDRATNSAVVAIFLDQCLDLAVEGSALMSVHRSSLFLVTL